MAEESDWSPPTSHDPNPAPPTADPAITLFAAGEATTLTVETLRGLSQSAVDNCFIVSTEHGSSGPFTFGGVALRDLLERFAPNGWTAADVISADGFRTRVWQAELAGATARPIVLALTIDGEPLDRHSGLVRLIVPGEERDALRQVKWVSEIRLLA